MTLWTQADSNKRRSVALLFFFVVIVMALGYLFYYIYGAPEFLFLAFIIALIQGLVGFYGGDAIVLATSGAQQIEKKDNPELWRIIENLTITAGLSMPKVYIIPDAAPNAFATGRDPEHASVAVTSGLLDRLDKNEISGVIAHELSHVGNYDIRLMTLVAILVGVIALISDIFIRIRWFGGGNRDNENQGGGILIIIGIVAALLAPLVATLVQLAISRKREFLADADGALLTRYPEGLASALEKISQYNKPVARVSSATAHLYIANPQGGGTDKDGETKQSWFATVFSTHPPIQERIKILREME